MIDDPYKVLGVSRDATKDEIKKAYRKKAKEYHPDLHPDDPEAAKKMNEVNEAYDMLNNPEKYKNRQQQNTYRNPYGDTYESNRQGGTGYGYGYGNNGNQGGYQGGYGTQWDFGDFNFDDIFGFSGRTYEQVQPKTQAGDSQEIKQAIDFINMKKYQYANDILIRIISSERNARWYFLSALANQGLGNTVQASEQIEKALQMEPNNADYQKVKQSLYRNSYTYNDVGRGFQKYAEGMNRFCMAYCLSQFFCMFCCH
jgi:molecular chaperone DnaJ